MRAVAKRAIVNLLNDDFLAKRIATDLVLGTPPKLAAQGIYATCSLAYQESSYICLEVIIGPTTLRGFLEGNAHLADAAVKYKAFMAKMTWCGLEEVLDTVFTWYIGTKMLTKIPSLIIDKLEKKLTAKIEMIVLREEEQGPFLISTIQALKDAAATSADAAATAAKAKENVANTAKSAPLKVVAAAK